MAKGNPERVRADLEWALDEVSTQLRLLPGRQLLEDEDLEWSLDAPHGSSVFVAVQNRQRLGARLEMTLYATTTGWLPAGHAYREMTVALQ